MSPRYEATEKYTEMVAFFTAGKIDVSVHRNHLEFFGPVLLYISRDNPTGPSKYTGKKSCITTLQNIDQPGGHQPLWT